jgi:hypothetical protein
LPRSRILKKFLILTLSGGFGEGISIGWVRW